MRCGTVFWITVIKISIVMPEHLTPRLFYEEYGIGQKLYNVSGSEVRILRPWETTSKNYSIFLGCSKSLYVADKVVGKKWENMVWGVRRRHGSYAGRT